jgi:DNA repair exonuclease SbcCD nuclease subunit
LTRLLHTSDVHVGQWATEDADREVAALAQVVDRAIREDVDLVVFAGDLFENNRVPQVVADAAAALLGRLRMPAVVLPGNHDPVDGRSVYDRMVLSSSVHVFRDPAGSVFEFPDLDLAVWGRAHTSYADDVAPLRGPPPRGDACFELAVAHGHYVEVHEQYRSYLISDDDIAACGRDYVALGHWDVPGCVGPGRRAWYSGSPSRNGVCARVVLERRPGSSAVAVQVEQVVLSEDDR